MRKLGEVLINDFMEKTTVNKEYDTIRPTGPRAFVSKEGCKQAEKLMQSLRKSAVRTRFGSIAKVKPKPPTLTDIDKILNDRGVK